MTAASYGAFDVVEVRAFGRVLVVGRGGNARLRALPGELGWRAARAIEDLGVDDSATGDLRAFWARQRAYPPPARPLSRGELLRQVAAAVRSGELAAALFPDVGPVAAPFELKREGTPLPHPGASTPAGATPSQPTGAPRPAAPPALRSFAAPTRPPLAGPPRLAAAAMGPAAATLDFDPNWTLEHRVIVVVRAAAARLPGEIGDQLLSLITPANIAITVAGFTIAAAAELTPYGWAADAALAGIAYAFVGLAGIAALRDLFTAVTHTAAAKNGQDLKDAAEALARAVTVLGVVALIAVLHGRASREGVGETSAGDRPFERTRPAPGPPKPGYQRLYRGDAKPGGDFRSEVAKTSGVDASNSMIDSARSGGTTSELFENHAVSNAGSPYISLSSAQEVAEHFARGVEGDQAGFVSVFDLPENFAEPNFENPNPWEREYLAPTEIDPKYMVDQYPVTPKGDP